VRFKTTDIDCSFTITTSVAGVEEESSGITFNEYDGFNRLVKVTAGDITADYQYNGDGLRTSKTVNDIEILHVWDGQQIVLEMNGAAQITNKYVRGITCSRPKMEQVRPSTSSTAMAM